jgi:hypothetical protein
MTVSGNQFFWEFGKIRMEEKWFGRRRANGAAKLICLRPMFPL